MYAHDKRVRIGGGVRVVDPCIDLLGDREPISRLAAAESQGPDVRPDIRLQALAEQLQTLEAELETMVTHWIELSELDDKK